MIYCPASEFFTYILVYTKLCLLCYIINQVIIRNINYTIIMLAYNLLLVQSPLQAFYRSKILRTYSLFADSYDSW